jgi:hypothetical protein
MILENLQSLPEFLRPYELVKMGLFTTTKAAYSARLRGKGPDFFKIGKRVLYPKTSVVEFINRSLQKGESKKVFLESCGDYV